MNNELDEEKLDNPLVVHKVTDASYQDINPEADLNKTHIEEETATLERHRFKKEKKSSKWPVVLVFLVVLIAVFCYLYFSGTLSKISNNETTAPPTETELTTESNRYAGIITVKGTAIFFEGTEVDGIDGLTREIKYLDEGTSFIVQNENADDTFLSEEILPLLDSYNIKYEVKFIVSSGLTAASETTTAAQETTSAEAADAVAGQ